MVDPDIFNLEDLDLDRLHANLVESEDTIQLLNLILASSESIDLPGEVMGDSERAHYEGILVAGEQPAPLDD